MRLVKDLGAVVGLPAALLVLWWVATSGSTDPYVPPLSRIVGAFGDAWTVSRFTGDVLPSLVRLAAGYTGAVVIAVLLGIAIGMSRTLRTATEPVLEFFRAIPAPVLVPVLIVIAGIGDGMKVSVIVFGCLWPILLNTVTGVRGVDEVLRDTAATLGMRRISLLRRLIIPAASPQIVAGMRQALSVAIILMVISEMFASTNGLGFTVVQFQRSFAIPEMWSGIIVLGFLGVALSAVFNVFERRVLRWYLAQRRLEKVAA